jgi:hypothetical protein
MHALKRVLTLAMFTAVSAHACPIETWSGATSAQWDVSTNWSPTGCVPGSTVYDTAIFDGTVGAGPTILLSTPAIDPKLASLTFDNAAMSFVISSPTEYLQFSNPNSFLIDTAGSHTINANIHLTSTTFNVEGNAGTLTIERGVQNLSGAACNVVFTGAGTIEILNNSTGATVFSVEGSISTTCSALNNVNTTTGGSSVGSEILTSAGNFTVLSGTTTNSSSGTIGSGLTGAAIVSSVGNFNQSGGTFINQNTGTLGSSAKGSSVQAGSMINLTGGSAQNLSSGPLGSSATGSSMTANALSISGGSLSNVSSGTISNNTAKGVYVNTAVSASSISSGSLSFTNQSSISGNGVNGCDFAAQALSMSGGTFNAINQGAISGDSNGCRIATSSDFDVSGGNVNFLNQNAISDPSGMGCRTALGGALNVSGGAVTNSNNSSITNSGIGSEISSSTLTINSGSLTNMNSGTVNGGEYGVEILTGGITMNGGSLTNENSGPIMTFNVGSYIESTGNVQLNGGTFTCSNSGNLTGAPANGSYVRIFGNMAVNGATVVNANSNNVVATAIGAIINPNSFSMTSGSYTNSNSASFSGGTGSYLNLTCTPLLLSGGTLTNDNTGTITGGGAGCKILCTEITMTGGKLVNSGPVTSSAGYGNLITADTSASTISGGTFVNNDTFQGVGIQVSGTGILGGTGIYQGSGGAQNLPVVNGTSTAGAGGFVEPDKFSPGNPGVMTINGSYTQNASGTLIINIFSPTDFSQLVVSSTSPSPNGTATINGGTLSLNIPIGALPTGTSTFPIIKANNGIFGNFKTILNNDPFVTATVTSTADTFILTTVSAATAPTTKLTNFPSVVFSNIGTVNRITEQQIFQMNTVIAENAEIPTTYPCANYLPMQKLFAANLPIEDLIAQEAPHKKGTKEKQQQLIQEIQYPPIPYPLTIYFGPIGTLGNYLTKHEQTGYRYWTGGGMFGFNYAFRQFGIGSSLTYQHTHENIKDHGGHSDTDEVDLNVYGSYVPQSLPQFALSAIVGAGYQWNSFPRITGFTDTPIVAKGFPNGWDFTSTLGVQYAFMNPPFAGLPYSLQIVPLADVQYSYLSVDPYREHRAGAFDLKYKEQHTKSLKLDLGFLINYTFFTPTTAIRPQLTLKWRREFLYKREKTSYAFVHFDEPYTTTFSKAPNLNTAEATFDLLTMFYGRFGIDFFYNFEWNTWFHDHTAYLNGTFSF